MFVSPCVSCENSGDIHAPPIMGDHVGAGAFGEVYLVNVEASRDALAHFHVKVPKDVKILIMKLARFYPSTVPPSPGMSYDDLDFSQKEHLKMEEAEVKFQNERGNLYMLNDMPGLEDAFPKIYAYRKMCCDTQSDIVFLGLFMQYAGLSLDAYIKKGLLPEGDEAKRLINHIIGRLIHIVATLHAKGYVHADLKPGNIAIEETKEEEFPLVRVLDVGSLCSWKEEAGEPCMPKAVTAPYTHFPLLAKTWTWDESGGRLPKMAYACLGRIHDWYGLIGTAYSLMHAAGLLDPSFKPWMEFVDTISVMNMPNKESYPRILSDLREIFSRVGKEFSFANLFIKILDLDLEAVIALPETLDDLPHEVETLCGALDGIDREGEGKRQKTEIISIPGPHYPRSRSRRPHHPLPVPLIDPSRLPADPRRREPVPLYDPEAV